jgi:CubicO group peptidase (beta-lactamase class C family)
MRSLLAGLLLSSSIPLCHAGVEGRIDRFVQAEMERQHIPGVALGVVKDGEVLVAKGYGLADVEQRVAVTPDTVFLAASITKQFTATAVMLLVQDGKLALDASITKYLPRAPATWKPITIRHLLTHTSGIADYDEDDSMVDWTRHPSEDEIVRLLYSMPLQFPAGARWNYSNTGYALLGIIIHSVTGKPWWEVLRERVFAPLGMKTAGKFTDQDIVPNRAEGYHFTEAGLRNDERVAPEWFTTADGGLSVSLLDLIAWTSAAGTGQVLDPKSWAQVFEPARLRSGRPYPYGFGWFVDAVAGQPVRRHCGDWRGYRTCLAIFPANGLTVIVLTNLGEAYPSVILRGVAAIVDPRLEPPALTPIADSEPTVTERLRSLLVAAGEPHGSARAQRGSSRDLPARLWPFFPSDMKSYKESLPMLREMGPPEWIWCPAANSGTMSGTSTWPGIPDGRSRWRSASVAAGRSRTSRCGRRRARNTLAHQPRPRRLVEVRPTVSLNM